MLHNISQLMLSNTCHGNRVWQCLIKTELWTLHRRGESGEIRVDEDCGEFLFVRRLENYAGSISTGSSSPWWFKLVHLVIMVTLPCSYFLVMQVQLLSVWIEKPWSLKLAVTFQNNCIIIHSSSNSNKAKNVSWKTWKYQESLFSWPGYEIL